MTCLEIYRCAHCGRDRAWGNPHAAEASSAPEARLNCFACGALVQHDFVELRHLSVREQARLRRKPSSAPEEIAPAGIAPKRPPVAARDGYESEIGWTG